MSPALIAAREVVHNALPAPRIDWDRTRCTVYAATSDEASHYAATLLETGRVDAGIEGWEYLRELGQVQHVYALRIGAAHVRVVSSPVYPRGQFSNLRALERRVSAPKAAS